MKRSIPPFRAAKTASLAVLAAAIVLPAMPASAQDTLAEARLRKMEAEIRALQRKVFPGGDGKFFEPEITPQAAGQQATPTQSSTSAVTDILTRMDALESQMARLTGQVEQNSNRLSQIEARLPGVPQDASPQAASPQTSATVPSPGIDVSPATPPATAAPKPEPKPAATTAPQSNLDAMTGGASAAKPATTAPGPSSERVKAVSAIVKPQTDDPADDEYSYGFRLWEAKFYPEAQQQLTIFVEKYPKHWRASWGRNLLGRAYLDDGKPREAAKWFLQNYQAEKTGGRAPDSLLYLAVSMKQLNDTKRACIALAEFSETYAAEAAGRLQGLYQATRDGLDCSA